MKIASFILVSFLLISFVQAEIIKATAAGIVKGIDKNKVKVLLGNKTYWIPQKDVVGNPKFLKEGQAVIVSLNSFDLQVQESKK